jgi:hypothetical protein
MEAAKGTQIGAQHRPCPFTAVAVDLASTIPIMIAGAFLDPTADCGMGWMTAPVALPSVAIQPSAASRKVFGNAWTARPSVRVVSHPQALLAGLARDQTDDRTPIIRIGPPLFALIGAPVRRVDEVAMARAFFTRVLIQCIRLKWFPS